VVNSIQLCDLVIRQPLIDPDRPIWICLTDLERCTKGTPDAVPKEIPFSPPRALSGTSNLSFLFSLSFFPCDIEMRSNSTEPWDKLGNNVDNCEDLDYKCAKSASSDDDVSCRQVTISLTLGRTGWKAEVTEVKTETACAGNNTVEGVAAGERKATLGRHEGGEKGPTMSENTWQDGSRAASEEACGETTRETSRNCGVSRVCGG